MNLLKEFFIEDNCSYLKENIQKTHYKVIDNCEDQECQDYIERGYRRFGKMYFRPICETCHECQSIKIDVENFTFSKSMRRIMNKGANIKVYIQHPSLTQSHLELFKKYHLHMKDKKKWEYQEVTSQSYYNSFVNGHNDFGYEVLYYDSNKLIGVDLVDMLKDGVSSIYFYYDPDYKQYSLGKLSLYNQIKFAQKSAKKWIYLGYYVQECASLAYKSEYKPYLTLNGRPNLHENFEWN